MDKFQKLPRTILKGAPGIALALILAACGQATSTVSPVVPSPTTSVMTVATVTPAPTTGAVTPTATQVPQQPTAASTTAQPTTTAMAASSANSPLKNEVRDLLGKLWQTYKQRYIQQDGRVVDPQRANASTSEGEAYALLRAFWEDDRQTFDNVLKWSTSNLQLPRGDKLFSYLWGKDSSNTWKVIDPAVATDADQDIAFALLLAADKWNLPDYQNQAKQILSDLWTKTVVQVNGKPYLTAGDWAPQQPAPVLNPSYLAPYEYRLFAQADPSHNWQALVDTSYEVISGCTTSKLDTGSGKLPPNWCAIDKSSGTFVAAPSTANNSLDTDFGYDAFRTVWRVALDYQWHGDKRAKDYLQSLTFLQNEWKTKQKLGTVYDHSGKIQNASEDLGVYSGSAVSLFGVIEPQVADQIVAQKLLPALKQTGQDDPDPAHLDATKARTYYAQNWTWFGLALFAGALPRP